MRNCIIFGVVVTIACFAQVRLSEAWSIAQPPDLALLFLLPLAAPQRRQLILLFAFTAGLILDSLVSHPLGSTSLAFMLGALTSAAVLGGGGASVTRRTVAIMAGLAAAEAGAWIVTTLLLNGGGPSSPPIGRYLLDLLLAAAAARLASQRWGGTQLSVAARR
jgi:rod shape-determining protein MreD